MNRKSPTIKKLPAHGLLLILLIISGCVAGEQNGETQTSEKPNIIFILTDDQRWDALGYAGNKIIHTPEMDKLAGEGAYFKNAFVTTPICAASRASFLTGLYERTHRYTFQVNTVREEQMNLSYPKILRENGYYTGFFGKFGVNYEAKDSLFDVYESYDRNGQFKDRRGYYYKTLEGDTVHLTRYTGQQALDFIDKAPSGQPFCLSLSFSAPHAHDPAPDQYFWQEEVNYLHQEIEMPGPALGEDQYFQALPLPVREGFNRTRWHWRYDTPEKYQHSVKGYYRMISGIDNEIAKIREQLQKKGLDKNTVIMLMGDNGYFLGERQLAGKWLMYDNCIRVPLIVYDPRVKQHRDIEAAALNIDVPATMLALADVEIPASWQGKSLLPLVKGATETSGRDTILFEHLWEFENIPPSEGVRTEEWKYLRYINNQSVEELYNLKDDPMEVNNLAGEADYQEVLATLRQKCDQLIDKYKNPYLPKPVNLTVAMEGEHDSNPKFLLAYHWKLKEGSNQQAYQILVASNKQNIDNNIGNVWDSHRVDSEESTNVMHEGKALQHGTDYYWKVRIWDQVNQLSEYSDPEKFTTGTR